MSFLIAPYWYKYPCTDYDVLLFLKVTGITDQTIASALCALVAGMKANGTWAKCSAIYPFVGATATTHKYNLKNPLNTDAAFRLSFVGGWTHSQTGAQPNGTNGYANTFLSPSLVQSVNNNGMGMYITERTVAGTDPVQMGCLVNFLTSASTNVVTPTSMSSRLNAANVVTTITGGAGNFDVHRTAATITKYYKNGVPIQTINSGGVLPNLSIFLGNLNLNGVPYSVGWINSEFRFAYIGQGLNDTESSSLASLVQQYQVALGRQIGSSYVTDTDAQAFINAANITNITQANAVNTLVTSLKSNGLWTKFNAIYPMVGGTALAHKFNLKNPLDTDAAFRLLFVNTWTHSVNGALPNGTNAYANTFFNSSISGIQNDHHISYYSRTDTTAGQVEIGNQILPNQNVLQIRTTSTTFFVINQTTPYATFTDTDSRGFYIANRTAVNVVNGWKSGVKVATGTTATNGRPNNNIYIGANNNSGVAANFSSKQCAFASIGTGLTDAEAGNYYTIVQAFQVALGRSIGTQTVTDSNAQAFINAAVIIDQVQTTAINNLVLNLKGNGLWTRMDAIYPFVGGTATTHKFNLKDPRDLDVAYRLFFSGGWVHSTNGALPNASNTYANTFYLYPVLNTGHLSFYSRTDSNGLFVDVGGATNGSPYSIIMIRYLNEIYSGINQASDANVPNLNSTGYYITARTASNAIKTYKNNTILVNATNAAAGISTNPMAIGAFREQTALFSRWSNRQVAFTTLGGTGMNDEEALALYNIVQGFQMELGRYLGFPVTLDPDANLFIIAAGITDLTQVSAINTLVTNLKIAQLWPKMKAIYPMVGGTALAHKFNLKNPADTNAAYRLLFSGGWTHSATGALPNGTNAYADTFLPVNSLTQDSTHNSYYSRSNTTSPVAGTKFQYEIGANYLSISPPYYFGLTLLRLGITSPLINQRTITTTTTIADTRGYYVGNRISPTQTTMFKNAQLVLTSIDASASPALSPLTIWLAANNGQPGNWSDRQCAFATIGDGLTDEEQSNLYTIIQYFQITLNRQV